MKYQYYIQYTYINSITLVFRLVTYPQFKMDKFSGDIIDDNC